MQIITYLNPDAIQDGDISSSKIGDINKSITWSDLKAKRDAGELIPGMQYRITDYQCTTVQENTRSANHQFDIIVTADDESTLNEVARAVKHDGDTYFAECDLNAWQIWYCLDNDTNRFGWADSTNGKGVIYRMIDEFNNDIPYDFKNIIYIFKQSFMYSQWGTTYEFTRDASIDMSIDGIQYYGYISNSTPSSWSENKCWIKEEVPVINSYLYKSDGNIISYGGEIIKIISSSYETYTFGRDDDLSRTRNCYNNTILPYDKSGILMLNNNIFNSNCHGNTFSLNCYNNLLGANCYCNILGNYCNNNSFGSNCYYNAFDSYCYYNILGNYCNNNSFGSSCRRNTLGNECAYNHFNTGCFENLLDLHCSRNSFGIQCLGNSLGDWCSENTFGDRCEKNSFATDNSGVALATWCRYNKFESGVSYCILINPYTGSREYYLQNYHIKSSVVGDSVKNIFINTKRNNIYDTTVALNSIGELKIYCEADLIK